MSKKILIIDDSALMRKVISDIINSDDRFEVADTAKNGLEGLDLIVKNYDKYDAALLDVNMPMLDGPSVLRRLQKSPSKLPVIMSSTETTEGAEITLDCLSNGAFDFVPKPENVFELRTEEYKQRLINTLVAATNADASFTTKTVDKPKEEIPVRPHVDDTAKAQAAEPKKEPVKHEIYKGPVRSKKGNKLIAIACSTGGPKSLNEVIPFIPKNIDAPILLVQHMPKGFTETLARRLNEVSEVTVKEATDGELIQKGHVYIAPGGKHLKVKKTPEGVKTVISDEPAVVGLKPCANLMYNSLIGMGYDEITCVVLTGMGADGTEGIGNLGKKENIYVIAQDKETSVVYGMPNMVAKANLTDEIVPLGSIAKAIENNVGVK